MAEISAWVYGWAGEPNSALVGPDSTTWPRYITAVRSVMRRTTVRLFDLIAACDAFISSSSSTVLMAMMFDRPIVTVNFNRVPHFDHFEGIGGTLHVRTPEEFSAAMHHALADDATRARLAAERSSVLERYTRFDGRATERIAELLVGAMGRVREGRPAAGVVRA